MRASAMLWPALLGLLLASVGIWQVAPRRQLIQRLAEELSEAPPADVARLLEQLAELGDEGLETVVRELSNERSGAAIAAGETLEMQLARWQALPLRSSSSKVATLARLLAAQSESLTTETGAVAKLLAMKILLWPIDRETVDAVAIVSDCARVVAAVQRLEINAGGADPRNALPVPAPRQPSLGVWKPLSQYFDSAPASGAASESRVPSPAGEK